MFIQSLKNILLPFRNRIIGISKYLFHFFPELSLLGAILFIVINLATDVAYAWVDPRVRVDRE